MVNFGKYTDYLSQTVETSLSGLRRSWAINLNKLIKDLPFQAIK